VLFYEAIARLPLGTAVTLEILGPLALSVLASRRLLSVLWATLALTGVVLLGHGGLTDLDAVGVGCALGAGGLWACYILTAQRSATTLAGLDGLALAMAVGAVAVAPFSLAAAGPALFSPAVLAAGAAVAALSSLLPYALEAISLRRLPSSTFAVLMSLAPAVAATTGAVLLDQPMDAISALAIACVVAASAGAVATSVRRPHHDHQSPRPSAQPSSPQDRRAVAEGAAMGHVLHALSPTTRSPVPQGER
jgi:inner membrane transporter RhtA